MLVCDGHFGFGAIFKYTTPEANHLLFHLQRSHHQQFFYRLKYEDVQELAPGDPRKKTLNKNN